MALNKKYAALPDLDNAPDIYETVTPELTDDASTNFSSPTQADRETHISNPNISNTTLNLASARSRFEPSVVDARDVDFSERVGGKRESYRTSTRQKRKLRNTNKRSSADEEDEELGDFSDGEDESIVRKLARLRREVQEVRDELEEKRAEKKRTNPASDEEDVDNATEQGVGQLSKILDSLSVTRNGGSSRAEAELSRRLVTSLRATSSASYTTVPPSNDAKKLQESTYTIQYTPASSSEQNLHKVTAFASRLDSLEKALGIDPSSIPVDSKSSRPLEMIPTLETLNQQITLLSNSSASSLGSLSSRVRQLTLEAEKLTAARTAAKEASEELRIARERDVYTNGTNSSDTGASAALPGATELDPETLAKVNALYSTLPTIESLTPILPAVLERLRSLRSLHGSAATASQTLEEVEKRQEEMGAELKRWREGLEKVEKAIQETEKGTLKNVKVVEGWVVELEKRAQKFES